MLIEMYQKNFEYDKAENLLKMALKHDPDNTRTLKNLAYHYEVTGETQKQIEIYEKLTKLLPDNVDFRYELAKLYRWNNRPKEELAQLEEIEKRTPNDTRLLERLIDFYYWQQEPQKALAIREQLMSSEPNNADHYLKLAADFVRLNRHNDAIEVYEKLISNIKVVQFYLELIDLYEWQKQDDKALASLMEAFHLKWGYAVKHPPKFVFPEAHLDADDHQMIERLGILYFRLKKYDHAVRLYEELLTKEPENEQARADYAHLFRWMNKNGEALAQYAILLQKNPDKLEYIHEVADIYIALKNFREAEKYYEQALSKTPYDVSLIVDMLKLYTYTEQPQKSLALISSLKVELKDNLKIMSLLGEVYFYAGQFYEAAEVFEKLNALEPHNEEVIKFLADSYLYSEQAPKAVKIYLTLVEKNPENQNLRKRLGMSLVYAGQHLDGIETLENYLKKNCDDIEINFLLGETYSALNWIDEAKKYFNQTIKLAHKKPSENARDIGALKDSKHIESKEINEQIMKAKALGRLSKPQMALKLLESLHQKYKKNEDVLLAYGYGLIENHDLHKAYDVLLPYAHENEKQEVYRAMASLFDEANDSYTAATYYNKILEKNPNDYDARLRMALDYTDLHRPYDAFKIFNSLLKEHPDKPNLRLSYESLAVSFAPYLKSHAYYKLLENGEKTRYEDNRFEYLLSNKLTLLTNLRGSQYEYTSTNENIFSFDIGGRYYWNKVFESEILFKQWYGGPKTNLGLKIGQNILPLAKQLPTLSFSLDASLNDLWTSPVSVIPYKGRQHILSASYSQEFLRNYITVNTTGGLQYSYLSNGGEGLERTLDFKLGVRVVKTNPKIVLSYYYFRDSPTQETREDSLLSQAATLSPTTKHLYIADIQYELPNKLLLTAGTTWSGHKNQREYNLFKGSNSHIGWSLSALWPITKNLKLTLSAGNSSAGAEGGIADQEAKVYLGQIEYRWF